jgi:hypothetical protein
VTKVIAIYAVILFGIVTFFSGIYDIYQHHPTSLSNELNMYSMMSIVALFPFYLLITLISEDKSEINFLVAVVGLISSIIAIKVYYGEVSSHDPSWGFSIIIVPILQMPCVAVVWFISKFGKSK